MSKIWIYYTFQPNDNDNIEVTIKHIITAKNKAEANKILIFNEKPKATEKEINKRFESTKEMLDWLVADSDLGVNDWDSYPHVNWVSLTGSLASPFNGVGYYHNLISAMEDYIVKNPNPELESMISKKLASIRRVESYVSTW